MARAISSARGSAGIPSSPVWGMRWAACAGSGPPSWSQAPEGSGAARSVSCSPSSSSSFGHGRRAGRVGLCSAVQIQPGHAVGTDTAAEGLSSFEHCHVEAVTGEVTGRDQPGNAPADHNAARAGLRAALGTCRGFAGSRHGYGSTEWMSSTTRVRTSGFVSGGTPCPRFTTWPGRCRARLPGPGGRGLPGPAKGASSSAGSMLPCSATRAAQPAVGFVQRQPVVNADDVDSHVPHGHQQFGGAGAEVDQRGAQSADVVQCPGRGRSDLGRCSPPGPANRPRSRRAGLRWLRLRAGRAGTCRRRQRPSP